MFTLVSPKAPSSGPEINLTLGHVQPFNEQSSITLVSYSFQAFTVPQCAGVTPNNAVIAFCNVEILFNTAQNLKTTHRLRFDTPNNAQHGV